MTDLLARQRERLGNDHPLTITSMNNLAAISSELRRFGEAESLFREVLAYWELRSPDHPNALTTLNNIGFLKRAQGDLAEAEQLFREVYARSVARLGDRHPTTVIVLYNLGGTLQRSGDARQAVRVFRRALASAEESPPTDQLTALLNGSLGRILAESSRCDEAVERLETSVSVLSTLPAHAAGIIDLRLSLGDCLIALGRVGEAEQPLLAAIDALAEGDARRVSAARSLVTVFETTGDTRADDFRRIADGQARS
jgi:tetratricopeptide (TPR) repeat protein